MSAEAATTSTRLLTAKEVADMIGMTADYVYALSRRGAIPTITFGRTRRYRREAIDEWLSALEGDSSQPPQRGPPRGSHERRQQS